MSDVLDILIGTNPKMTSSARMTFLLDGFHYYSCVSVRLFLPEKMHTLQYIIILKKKNLRPLLEHGLDKQKINCVTMRPLQLTC